MKKILTLLTLALLGITGAWADETVTVTWLPNDMTEISSAGTANVSNVLTVNNLAISSSLSGPTLKSANNTNWGLFDTKTTDAGKNNASNKDCITFSVTVLAGYNYTPTSITATIGGNATGDNGGLLTETTISNNTSAKIAKASEGGTSLSVTPTSTVIESGNTYTFYIYIGSRANTDPVKGVCVKDVVLTGTYTSSSVPSFGSSVDKMEFAVNPITTSKDGKFTLSGRNLTDGTYNLNVPSVAGLSVSPTSFTVADGQVDQEFTVTYTSTVDVAEAVANITAEVNGITASVAVTYSSIAALYTQQPITGATTWDWSKYGVKEINTSGTSFERTDVLVGNVEFYGYDAPAAAFGPANALTLNGDFIVRDSKYCQISSAKFSTTVPGLLKVVFSNTGGNRPYRYLYVNGKNTGVGSNSTTNVTAANIYVPAGDVVLTNIIDPNSDDSNAGNSSFIRVSSIEFSTTFPENTSITIDNGKGYRTFASKYPTDWSNATDITAYTASVSNGDVTFSKVTGTVPAGEGLLLKGDDNTYNIPVVNSAEPINNALIGVIADTKISKPGIFVLYADDTHTIGFYKTSGDFTVGANTAYLPADVAPARSFIGLFSETTGIDQMENGALKSDGSVYNLNGQRVNAPTKGLYIMNGKKMLVK